MAYIRVDLESFELTAKQIDNFVDQAYNNMTEANSAVSSLLTQWEGIDSEQFKNQWNKLFKANSVYKCMVNDLGQYSQDLRETAKAYRLAQEEAVERAREL